MALTDPRSVIREILARRPDLHAAFAPQLSAMGVQVAGPAFSGETRRRADAVTALQAGQVPPTTLGPVPTNMGGFPPRATPESANMEFGRERERAVMRSPETMAGDPGNWSMTPPTTRYDPLSAAIPSPPPAPGSQDFGREYQRAAMRSPETMAGDPGNWSMTPGLTDRGPMPPSFGADPSIQDALSNRAAAIRNATPFAGNLPQPRQTMAPGSAERLASPLPPLPQARPSPGITPGPMPPSMGLPQRPTLAGDTGGLPPQIAALMGGSSPLAPSIPPSGAPFSPYGPNASLARMPQSRPPQMPQARPDIPSPAPGPPPPLSPDQRIAAAPNMGGPPPSAPTEVARRAAAAALGLGAGTPNLSVAGLAPYQSIRPDLVAGSPAPTTSRLPRPRPAIDTDMAPASPLPGDIGQGSDLPPPGPASSLTPSDIQRTMGAQALYNQPPPGMGDRPFPGAPPTPPPAAVAPAQQTPYGRGAGRLAGTLLGVGAGLASGSLPAAIVEGGLGYKLGGFVGRKVGQAINPNAPPPLDASGVPAITPPPPPPPQQQSMPGGIFGAAKSGMRALKSLPRELAAMVRDGRLPLAEAQRMVSGSGSAGSSVSGGNWAGNMGGNTGGGGSGWGGWGGGGTYGGGYGRNLTEGVGGAFRNR